MDDPLDVDLALWGKLRGLPTRYPLICHLLDSAAAVEALWDHHLCPGLRASLAGGLGTNEMHVRSLLAYWAGLHDICKCMSCFQEQDKIGFGQLADYPEVNATPKGHAFAAHVWLGQLLSALGYKVGRTPSPAIRVAQLLGGHHGTFSPFNHHEFRYPLASLPALGEGRWEEQRQAIAAVVHELTVRFPLRRGHP